MNAKEKWTPHTRSNRAVFTSSLTNLAICADHPDVFDAGLTTYDRLNDIAHGFVHLHRRRSEAFIRKWVLPRARKLYRVKGAGAIKQLQHDRIKQDWCAAVVRKMQDIRLKACQR
jgi:hypothetical protein